MPPRQSEIEERVLARHLARFEGLGLDLSDPLARLGAENAIRSTLFFRWECLDEAFADFRAAIKEAIRANVNWPR